MKNTMNILNLKRLVLIAFIIFSFVNLRSSSPEYYMVMTNNVKIADTTNSVEGLIAIADQFEQVSSVDTSEWLPLYYAAFALSRASFSISDNAKRDATVDHAIELLNKALALNPGESEIFALLGFTYLAKLNVQPMVRGMEYTQKAQATLEQAKAMNPANPRPEYLIGTITYHMPSFLGGGKEKALPQLQAAMLKFDAFTPSDSIMPNWGRRHCLSLINQK